MSVLHDDIQAEQRRRPAAHNLQALDGIHRLRADAAALCSCTVTSVLTPAGEVLVLRIAGEVDLLTISILRSALTSSLARGPCHLLIDLADLTFCSVRGLSLLVEAGGTAAAQGTGYGVTAASRQADRAFTVLWPVDELPTRYPTTAAGMAAAMAGLRTPAPPALQALRVRPV